jgi:hypothetical protein
MVGRKLVVNLKNATDVIQELQADAEGNLYVRLAGGSVVSVSPLKTTDLYGINAISEDSTYKYFWFEADDTANVGYYIMRKHKVNGVFEFTKGLGSYTSVYQSPILGPSGSPTWASRGATF